MHHHTGVSDKKILLIITDERYDVSKASLNPWLSDGLVDVVIQYEPFLEVIDGKEYFLGSGGPLTDLEGKAAFKRSPFHLLDGDCYCLFGISDPILSRCRKMRWHVYRSSESVLVVDIQGAIMSRKPKECLVLNRSIIQPEGSSSSLWIKWFHVSDSGCIYLLTTDGTLWMSTIGGLKKVVWFDHFPQANEMEIHTWFDSEKNLYVFLTDPSMLEKPTSKVQECSYVYYFITTPQK